MGLFIDVTSLPAGFDGDFQLAFLLAVYAYVLYIGCDLISEGSELLMLTPYSKLVGSCVLPVLGAVPDGAIVLFSGVGPEAQTQLDVGIGALAGSTVMLLTIPWILAVAGGRVDLNENGEAVYSVPKGQNRLTPSDSYGRALFHTGVGVAANPDAVKNMALCMVITLGPLVIIQAAAFAAWDVDDDDKLSHDESVSAFIAFLYAVLAFILYLAFQWYYTQNEANVAFEEKKIDNIVTQIKKNQIRLVAAVKPLLMQIQHESGKPTSEVPLLEPGHRKMLGKVLRPFFWKYDADGNGKMDINELNRVFVDMGEKKKAAELNQLFGDFDQDKSGFIDFAEFVEGVKNYVFKHENLDAVSGKDVEDGEDGEGKADEEVDEDEEEVPDDLKDLSPEEQQKAVLRRSTIQLMTGTLVVLVFSDPMVDVLDEIGTRTSIPDFYVAFVLAPIVTNGSEMLASYTFALKKTSPSIVCSFQQLLGAAVMNNTYCVAVFMGLVYFQSLYWSFTAETAAIIFVEACMLYFAFKPVHRLIDGFMVLSLYPISLGLVAFLTYGCGLTR